MPLQKHHIGWSKVRCFFQGHLEILLFNTIYYSVFVVWKKTTWNRTINQYIWQMNYSAFRTPTKSYFLPFFVHSFVKLLRVSLTTLIKHIAGNPFINVNWREIDNAATNKTWIKKKDSDGDSSHSTVEIFNVSLVYQMHPTFLHQACRCVINFNFNHTKSVCITFPQWFSVHLLLLLVVLRKQIQKPTIIWWSNHHSSMESSKGIFFPLTLNWHRTGSLWIWWCGWGQKQCKQQSQSSHYTYEKKVHLYSLHSPYIDG